MSSTPRKGVQDTSTVTSDDPMKRDFRVFLTMLWRWLLGVDPTPLQLDMAYRLQHGPDRDVIEAFRGASKSWITGAYALWLLHCNPHLLILVVSASGGRAAKMTNWCLNIIRQWPPLAHLKPRSDQRQSSLGFDVGPAADALDQQPSMEAKGITGQLAGGRADVIIPDDVEIPNNSDTETKREKLREQIREFDAILRPGGKIKFLGTPQSTASIYPVLKQRGYALCVWPMLFPAPADLDTEWGLSLAPSVRAAVQKRPELVGKCIEPTRFPEHDVAARRLSYGSLGFALQFQLDTSSGDANRFPLKLDDLVVMDCSDPQSGPEQVIWAGSKEYRQEGLQHYGREGQHFHKPMHVSDQFISWQESLMYVDPSGRGKDETAYAVVRFLNGRLFLTRFGGLPGGYDEPVLKMLGKIAEAENLNEVWVEDNFGQGMFAALLKPYLPCPIETDRVTTQKEHRIIQALEPVMSSHRFVVDRSAMEKDFEVFGTEHGFVDNRSAELGEDVRSQYSLTYQMSHITQERNSLPKDDRLDAVAGAVRKFVERMDAKTGQLETLSRDRRLEEDLQNFMRPIFEGAEQYIIGVPETPDNILTGGRKK